MNTSGNQTFVDKLTAIWESSSSFKWQRKEDKEDMQSMKKQKHGNETDVVPVFFLSEPYAVRYLAVTVSSRCVVRVG